MAIDLNIVAVCEEVVRMNTTMLVAVTLINAGKEIATFLSFVDTAAEESD